MSDYLTKTDRSRSLYCFNCCRHTKHEPLTSMYADRCTICNIQTGRLERSHAASVPLPPTPDGVHAEVVHNTPNTVTFYVATGEHRGYYDYDKHKGTHEIRQAK